MRFKITGHKGFGGFPVPKVSAPCRSQNPHPVRRAAGQGWGTLGEWFPQPAL